MSTPAASAAFARRWATAIRAEPDRAVLATLTRLTDRLAGALAAEPFESCAGQEVGAALVGVQLGSAETIDGTVDCLSNLNDALGLEPSTDDDRLPDLIGAVVTGYASAVQAVAMDEANQQPQPH